MFHSSLAPKGRAKWSQQPIDSYLSGSESAEAELDINFPEVDWASLQSVYGWAALQYQAWARGSLVLEASEPHKIALHTDRVLEFWVDGMNYFGGDFYSYRRAPLVLNLQPGTHKFDVRVIRDLRLMGGIGEPKASIYLKAGASKDGLVIVRENLLIPEIVDNMLASSYASIPVRNEGETWLNIWKVESVGAHPFLRLRCGAIADNPVGTLHDYAAREDALKASTRPKQTDSISNGLTETPSDVMFF